MAITKSVWKLFLLSLLSGYLFASALNEIPAAAAPLRSAAVFASK